MSLFYTIEECFFIKVNILSSKTLEDNLIYQEGTFSFRVLEDLICFKWQNVPTAAHSAIIAAVLGISQTTSEDPVLVSADLERNLFSLLNYCCWTL